MAPKNRLIIDTDPGVDDVLALLLALSAKAEEVEVLMISVTYGNVSLQSCLRNVVALFHVVEKEMAWRKSMGQPEGFETMRAFKPLVAVGAEHPLEDETLMADHFHGADGLHGVHEEHPHLSPSDTWKQLFAMDEAPVAEKPDGGVDPQSYSSCFTASKKPAHEEILRLLRENPEDTVSICSLGPLTNVARAAAADPAAFLRVRELVVMGGAVGVPGNITPLAEFNCYADAVAAARVYALTSRCPRVTMPPVPDDLSSLGPYPEPLPGGRPRLRLTLFPLDITTPHVINSSFTAGRLRPLVESGSPLALWTSHFLSKTFDKITSMVGDGVEPELSLHDPMTIWYVLTRSDPGWRPAGGGVGGEPEDIRIETCGQWSRGMHIVDRRNRKKPTKSLGSRSTDEVDKMDTFTLEEIPGDHDNWLNDAGNNIIRMVGSPGEDVFADYLMKRIFE